MYGVRGGVEPAFMSTTTDRDVAAAYAAGSGAGIILEMEQGMVDRGGPPAPLKLPASPLPPRRALDAYPRSEPQASPLPFHKLLPQHHSLSLCAAGSELSWLSQYPHEQE